jgi:hypothetical protein
MKAHAILIPLCLTLLAGAAPPEDPTTNDVRCWIVAAELAGAADPAVKSAGLIGSQYFLGGSTGGRPASISRPW